jgi:DNA repair exonuclease SbcCD ATPase subunit
MTAGFGLRRLAAEGFRGIGEELDLNLHPSATLVLAPNGSGKTSILGAIEWGLFGELHDQPRENATNDELVNVHHHPREARVVLELANRDDTLVVERTKRIGKRASALTVTFSGVRRFQDAEAEQFLFQRLGLTFEDFYRAIYLHQESIRGLLVDEPKVRNESLDRLFGVDKLRDILTALSPKAVRERIKDIEAEKGRATERLQGSIDAVNDRYERALQDAKRDGLAADELTVSAGARMLAEVVARLAGAAAQVGYADAVSIETPETWSDLDRLARRARELVKAIRERGIGLQLGTGTSDSIATAVQARTRLEAAAAEAGKASGELAVRVQLHGSSDQIEQRLTEARQALANLDAESHRLGAHQSVVAESISYLRADPDAQACPVCGRPIDSRDLIVRLQESLQDEVRRQVEQLHDKQTAKRTEIGSLQSALAESQQASRASERAQSQLTEARSAAIQVIGHEAESEAVANALGAKIRELEAAAARNADARGKAESLLSDVETDIDRVRVLYRCLQAGDERSQAMARLGTMDSEESQADAQLTALGDLEDGIETIARAVQEVAGERARVALEGSQDRVGIYYGELCNHPYFDRLRIAVEEQRVMGTARNNYIIRAFASSDGEATLASSRLSTAQMNCAALSIYLALASGLEHNLGFLLMDDPSQSLDAEHKQSLASLLFRTSQDVQVVIATHDEEFAAMLKSQWSGDSAAAYKLDWSAQRGTTATRNG